MFNFFGQALAANSSLNNMFQSDLTNVASQAAQKAINKTTGGSVATTSIPTINSVGAIKFSTAFTWIINTALYIGGAIAVIYLIYGGITYVTAGGEPDKATQARTIIVNAIIGIIIIALALSIVGWVNGAIGNSSTGVGSF
ncbi:MAG: hypothetical protein WCP93_01215 [Candidatus Berkelbacteria bacterium]